MKIVSWAGRPAAVDRIGVQSGLTEVRRTNLEVSNGCRKFFPNESEFLSPLRDLSPFGWTISGDESGLYSQDRDARGNRYLGREERTGNRSARCGDWAGTLGDQTAKIADQSAAFPDQSARFAEQSPQRGDQAGKSPDQSGSFGDRSGTLADQSGTSADQSGKLADWSAKRADRLKNNIIPPA